MNRQSIILGLFWIMCLSTRGLEAVMPYAKWCGPCSGISAGYLRDFRELEVSLGALLKKGNVALYFVNTYDPRYISYTSLINEVAHKDTSILFVMIDAKKYASIATEYRVKEEPSLLLFKGGSVMNVLHGIRGKNEIMRAIQWIYHH